MNKMHKKLTKLNYSINFLYLHELKASSWYVPVLTTVCLLFVLHPPPHQSLFVHLFYQQHHNYLAVWRNASHSVALTFLQLYVAVTKATDQTKALHTEIKGEMTILYNSLWKCVLGTNWTGVGITNTNYNRSPLSVICQNDGQYRDLPKA